MAGESKPGHGQMKRTRSFVKLPTSVSSSDSAALAATLLFSVHLRTTKATYAMGTKVEHVSLLQCKGLLEHCLVQIMERRGIASYPMCAWSCGLAAAGAGAAAIFC